MDQHEPIRCFLLDHGFHNYTNGPCCHTDIFDVSSHKHLRTHAGYIEIKQSMDAGRWHEQCSECANVESRPGQGSATSKRQMWSSSYRDVSAGSTSLLALSYDVGKLCNLACRTCGPRHSSSWIKEWEQLEQSTGRHVKDYDAHRLSMDLHTQSLKDLRFLELLGGEPLYNLESYELMHRVIEETDNQCMIAITSNGTIFPDLKRYPWLQNNPNIVITISVDAVGRAAEFIRTGTDWTRVEKNVKRFQDIGLTVGYHVTHSVLNLFELDAVESWRIANDMPPCQLLTVVSHCDHLSFAVLTPEEKHEVCRYLSDRHGRFLIPYIQSSSYDSRQRKKFEDFMCHTQKYHGLDWRDYLPDLWRLLMPAS